MAFSLFTGAGAVAAVVTAVSMSTQWLGDDPAPTQIAANAQPMAHAPVTFSVNPWEAMAQLSTR